MYFSPWSQALGFSLRPRQKKSYWMFLMQIDLSFHWLSIDCKGFDTIWLKFFDFVSLSIGQPPCACRSIWTYGVFDIFELYALTSSRSHAAPSHFVPIWKRLQPICLGNFSANSLTNSMAKQGFLESEGQNRHENKELTHVTSRSMFFVRTSPKFVHEAYYNQVRLFQASWPRQTQHLFMGNMSKNHNLQVASCNTLSSNWYMEHPNSTTSTSFLGQTSMTLRLKPFLVLDVLDRLDLETSWQRLGGHRYPHTYRHCQTPKWQSCVLLVFCSVFCQMMHKSHKCECLLLCKNSSSKLRTSPNQGIPEGSSCTSCFLRGFCHETTQNHQPWKVQWPVLTHYILFIHNVPNKLSSALRLDLRNALLGLAIKSSWMIASSKPSRLNTMPLQYLQLQQIAAVKLSQMQLLQRDIVHDLEALKLPGAREMPNSQRNRGKIGSCMLLELCLILKLQNASNISICFETLVAGAQARSLGVPKC